MKKNSFLILFLFLILLVSGCSESKDEETVSSTDNDINNNSIVVEDDVYDKDDLIKVECERLGEAEGLDVELKYTAYHDGVYLIISESLEKVSSDDESLLDPYEDAYNTLDKTYEGIEHYNSEVIRDENSVRRESSINYQLVDTSKIIAIEGSEDNIFEEDGSVKYNTWLTLFKKLGGTCEE